jgi:transcriptional regulator with XRE-family HTH domain
VILIDGETLRKVRIALKLTQDEVGALCGVTNAMVNKVERGKYPITERILAAVNREFTLTRESLAVYLTEYDRIVALKQSASERGR